MSEPLLSVRDLRVSFATEAGPIRAVDGLDFEVRPGEVYGIVGESGSGKSMTALSVMGLLPAPGGSITAGEIRFAGEDLRAAPKERLRELRGDRMAMIFQDPLSALNPVHRLGHQVAEAIVAHRDVARDEAWDRAVALLETVGIPRAAERARDYPHQFSGGMRQRAMIAMAVALEPDLLIADEPTTALDVTIQAQILEMLLGIRERIGTAILLITHDLGIVAGVADRVMVMYAGRKAEEGTTTEIFEELKHPYTWGLLGSSTRIDRPRQDRLVQIPGAPPDASSAPPGCRFAPRCAYAQDLCRETDPPLAEVSPGHGAACHFARVIGWRPGVPVTVAAAAAEARA